MKWTPLITLVMVGLVAAEEKWSNCWTAFVSGAAMCENDLGSDWEALRTEGCGFLGGGNTALCTHSYSGCSTSACYSSFISYETMCSEFNDTVKTGGTIDSCAPGFVRVRCCPN